MLTRLLIGLAWLGMVVFQAHRAQGQTAGIASRYPGDGGIESDPDVIFVEMFEEESLSELFARWEDRAGAEIMSFSPLVPENSSGEQSFLMTHVGGQGTGCHLYRRFLPGHDRLHVRFYVRFDPDCYPIHHLVFFGGREPSYPWPVASAGIRPDGTDRFSTGLEPMGAAWRWDFYTYWMEMRGAPDGKYWGNDFIQDPNLGVARGEWICVEAMIKVNSPLSESNGEQALWIDGRLWSKDGQTISRLGPGFPNGKWVWDSFIPDPASPPFEGYRWRIIEELKINYLWLLFYITEAPAGHVSKVWFDHVVVARDYVGPMDSSPPDPTPVPTSVNGPWLRLE